MVSFHSPQTYVFSHQKSMPEAALAIACPVAQQSPMKIAIDATYTRQSSGGIPRYGRELVRALRGIAGVEKVVELGAGSFERRGSLRRVALTAGLQLAWYPWLGRRRAKAIGADVMHCLLPRGPVSRGRPPLVVTVHDLVPFRFPESMTRWGRFYARATHRPVIHAADLIIVQSSDTANDVARLMGVPDDRIRVIPMGVDSLFFEPREPPAKVVNPYVLFVGCANPRKNLERLESAVGILRSRGYPHELVLVGEDTWGRVAVDQPFVRKLGKVSDEDLRRLYAGAACLAIPSLHEGFGFPAVEAMAGGTPVVASREGSLPEVTGGAAVMVDAYDTTDIADGLQRAITNGAELRDAGRKNAARFTWQRTAEMTLAVYRELT